MRIRSNAARLLIAATLSAVALLQSCVGDTATPEEEPGDWIDVPIPPLVSLDVNALAADAHGTLFMGGNSGAPLWRSVDRGVTWTQMTAGLTTRHPATALLVKRGETAFASLEGAGVFVSRNRGESWTQVNNHLTDLEVRSLTAAADGSLIAGTSNGRIFRSSNDGGVWSEVLGTPISTRVTALVTGDNGIVYAGTLGQGVFFSADSGLTWTPSSDNLASLRVLALAIDGEGGVLAGGWADGVYRSAGSGARWERIDGGAIPDDVVAIAVDQSGAIFAGTKYLGVLRSQDGGDSWEGPGMGLRGLTLISLLCEDGVLLAGTDREGVFRSVDEGSSWSLPRNYCPADQELYFYADKRIGLSIDDRGAYYHLRERAILRSRGSGETWMRTLGKIWDQFTCLAVHPNSSLLAGTQYCIYVSYDSGDSWSFADTSAAGQMSVYALETAPNGTVFGWTNKGVLKFTNGCSSYECVFEPAPGITAIGTGSAGHIYLGTRERGVLRSSDEGGSWQRVTDSLWVYSIEADTVGNVFAVSEDMILCSGDDGDTWRKIELHSNGASPQLPKSYSLYHALAAPGGEITVICNTSANTFYISSDRFSTWRTEIVPFDFFSACLSPDGHLFALERFLPVMHRSGTALF